MSGTPAKGFQVVDVFFTQCMRGSLMMGHDTREWRSVLITFITMLVKSGS